MDRMFLKKKLKRILPPKLYEFGRKIRRKFILPIVNYKSIKKLKKFNRPIFKKLTLFGKKMFLLIDPKNGITDANIFLKGVHEPPLTNLICKKINKDDTFLDIGANIGYFTNLLPLFCKKVIAFEPIKKIYEQNLKSIKKNNYKNVDLQNYACGEKKSQKTIYITNSNLGGSSLIKEKLKLEDASIDDHETIRIVKLDDFLSKRNEEVNFMKIDVEGFEFEVLKGAKKTLKKFHPKIIMEFSPFIYENDYKGKSKDIIKFLENLGYEINNIRKNKRFSIKDISKIGGHIDLYCE